MPEMLRKKIETILTEAGHRLPPIDTSASEQENLRALLNELQPFDIALLLVELTSDEQMALLEAIPKGIAAEALDHIDHEQQYRLLDDMDQDVARAILKEMPIDHLVDLISSVHPLRAQVILGLTPEEHKAQIDDLLTYKEDTAGRRMTVSYLEARQNWTVERAIAHFRKVGRNVEITNYIYVVDDKGRPVGVASLRDILLSPANTTLEEIMYTKVITVHADTNQEEAAKLLTQYDFVALPVVNEAGSIVGVLSVDEMMDVVEEEATEDFQRLGGTSPVEESYLAIRMSTLFRSRVGWLLVLFVAESFTGTIMRHFESVLDQVVALAFFIPLLIDTGGNSGSQASTLVIRAMALGEVKLTDFIRVIWREIRVSLLLGLVMALAAFLRAWMLGGPPSLGLTVAITICLIVIVGSTVGAALPLIGRRFGVDPAVFSAPLITTVADGVGLYIYFKVAVWLLNLG